MPKLLQINVTCNQGSTGKIAEQVGLCAMAHGWESYVAYGRYANRSSSQSFRVGTEWDVRIHALQSRLLDNSGLGSSSATLNLIDKIREIKPDIIHLHNIHGYYMNYCILFDYLKEYGRPVIWTLHDCWPFTGHCAFFDYPRCDKWKDGCERCPHLNKYPASWGYDRSFRNYIDKRSAFLGVENLTLVPVSNWLGGLLKLSFLQSYPIQVIHNGVDLANFEFEERTVYGRFQLIGVSNVWEPRKGLTDIFRLRNLLSDDYEILLVGLSSKQLKELPKGITGICRTESQRELAELYASSDVLINPTYEDNFPTVNLEALACGTPVITYRTGGSPEAVDNQTGIVVEQGDVEGLAKAVRRLRSHPLSSEACRQRAERLFDKDKCFEKYLELYERLLECSRYPKQ